MHPTIGYQLATALITDHHRRADHDQAAHAARQASRAQTEHPQEPVARRIATALARRARLPRRRIA